MTVLAASVRLKTKPPARTAKNVFMSPTPSIKTLLRSEMGPVTRTISGTLAAQARGMENFLFFAGSI